MTRQMVLALGGSVYNPSDFRSEYLEKLSKLLSKYKDIHFFVVCGGGALARARCSATEGDSVAKDMAGISGVNENAEKVRVIFSNDNDFGSQIVTNLSQLKEHKQAICGASEPGHSTDGLAVKVAEAIGAKELLNLSDIDFVFDKNPKEFEDAKPFINLTWNEYFKIVGRERVPSGHYPFDPVASENAEKNGIKVSFVNGNNLGNISKFLSGSLPEDEYTKIK